MCEKSNAKLVASVTRHQITTKAPSYLYVWVVVYQPRVLKRDAWSPQGTIPVVLGACTDGNASESSLRAAQTDLHAVHAAITVEKHEPKGSGVAGDACISHLALRVRGADNGSELAS